MSEQYNFDLTTGHFRHTSHTDNFPYTWKTVPFICIRADGCISMAQELSSKSKMLTSKGENDVILAVWPGQWRSDVFVVDDTNLAMKALTYDTT